MLLALLLILGHPSAANEALDKAQQAFYIQSGVQTYAQQFEDFTKRELPALVQATGLYEVFRTRRVGTGYFRLPFAWQSIEASPSTIVLTTQFRF